MSDIPQSAHEDELLEVLGVAASSPEWYYASAVFEALTRKFCP